MSVMDDDIDITQIDVKCFRQKKDQKSVLELINYIAKGIQWNVDTRKDKKKK